MANQLTVRLPTDLSRALRAAARRTRTKRAEIVRSALRAYLGPLSWKKGHAYERAGDLIGSLDSGIPDLAERHSEYLYEALTRGR